MEARDDTTTPLSGDGATIRTEELARVRLTYTVGSLVAGRYRIEALVAKGGMGEVYRARDMLLHHDVALKVVGRTADGATAQARFRREIQLARKVAHPRVAHILDVGVDGSHVFLTMELLRGGTLAERLRKVGPIPVAQAYAIACDIAAALDAAHRMGVIHRDLKASNVMFDQGRAVVTDFGIARDAAGSPDESVTGDGVMVGSPPYMAPEQVEGRKELTCRVDIYSFGVVLYEMVAGRVPFQGETALETAMLRLRDAPRSPRAHVPELPRSWEAAILRCLERDPARRFATAGEVVAALSRPPRRRWPLAIAAVAVGAAAVGIAAYHWPARRQPPRAEVVALHDEGRRELDRYACAAARAPLERAVATDDAFAPAHSALAEAWSCLGQETRALTEARRGAELAAALGDDAREAAEAELAELDGKAMTAVQKYRALFARFPDRFDYGRHLAELEIDIPTGQPHETVSLLRRIAGRNGAVVDLLEARLVADDPRAAVDAYRRAEASAEAEGSRLVLARVLLEEAVALARGNRMAEANADVQRGLALYRDAGDTAGMLRALGLVVAGYAIAGDADGVRRTRAEAQAIGETLDSSSFVEFGESAAFTLRSQGDEQGAIAAEEELRDWARRRRRFVDEAWALQRLSRFSLDVGDPLTSARQTAEAIALVAGTRPVAADEMRLSLAVSLALMGKLDDALRIEQSGHGSATSRLVQNGGADWVAGILAFVDGRYGDAAELLARALPRRRGATSDAVAIQLLRARALIELGQLDEAKKDIDAVASHLGAQYPSVFYQTDLDITRAAWQSGGRRPEDLADAEATLTAAVARLRQAGLHGLAVGAELYLGRAKAWRGKTAEADAIWRAVEEEGRERHLGYFAELASRSRAHDGAW